MSSEFASRSVDHMGWLASQLGDLQGFDTMACELIQNADDAGASDLEFVFQDDRLEVINDASFTECGDPLGAPLCALEPPCDFHSFRSIAGRGKRDREGTTGVFGIGFTSVYQVTDHPELISGGYHVILDEAEPELQRMRICQGCDLEHESAGTRFLLPWATSHSEFRIALDRLPVTADDVQGFPADLIGVGRFALLFLRHLERLTLRTQRETWSFERQVLDGKVVLASPDETTEWLVLSTDFEEGAGGLRESTAGIIPAKKSTTVRVAVPATSSPAGGVHATLPTTMTLPVGIRIDADFFPNMNRKSVVLESDHRSSWNRFAFRAAAVAFASHMELVAEHTGYPALWTLIQQSYAMSKEADEGTLDEVFGACWEEIAARIAGCAVLPTVSGGLVAPSEARYPDARAAYGEAQAMLALDIPAAALEVFDQLQSLPRAKAMGMANLTADIVVERLADRSDDGVALTSDEASGVRRLLNVLFESQSRSLPVPGLKDVAIIPLEGGQLGAGADSFLMDDETWRTFTAIDVAVPRVDVAVLRDESPALLDYCLEWEARNALDLLGTAEQSKLEEQYRSLLMWFRGHTTEMTASDCDQLAATSIWPTGQGFAPLTSASLPGFKDPIGIASLLSLGDLEGLVDFARELGAQELSAVTYVRDFAVPALLAGQVSRAQARKLLRLVTDHRAELEQHPLVRRQLSSAPLLETVTGEPVAPEAAYFFDARIAGLGDVLVIPQSQATSAEQECLRWLGVASDARVSDIVRAVDEVAAAGDAPRGLELFEGLSFHPDAVSWGSLEAFNSVRAAAWLPTKRGTMLPPKDLIAVFNEILFDTQDRVLAAPRRVQDRAQNAGLLANIGIQATPPTWMVVEHLLACVERGRDVRPQVYETLNRSSPESLVKLQGTACIQVEGSFRRADEVYWAEAPFGEYSSLLGEELRGYSNFFDALGVKEKPDHADCVDVLDRISTQYGHDSVDSGAKDVVLIAWRLLNRLNEIGEIDAGWLREALSDLPSVLASDGRLRRPTAVVFMDAQEHAARFQLISNDLIVRQDGVWRAQLAAGVRPFESLTQVELDSATDPELDEHLHEVLHARQHLVKAVFEFVDAPDGSAGELDTIQFTSVSDLAVRRTLSVFNREETQFDPDPQCFVDLPSHRCYLKRTQRPRWKLVARELALGLAPSKARELTALLAAVFEEESTELAQQALGDLGVPLIELLPDVDTASAVATAMGGASHDQDSTEIDDVWSHDEEDPLAVADGNAEDALVENTQPGGTAGDIADESPSEVEGRSRSATALPGEQVDRPGGQRPHGDTSTEPPEGHGDHPGSRSGAGLGAARSQKRASSSLGDAPQTRMVSYVIPAGSRDERLVKRYESESPEVEAAGVAAVLEHEIEAGRTPEEMPPGNPGYDIESNSSNGELLRVIEVKATAARWAERGVPMSARQYEECRMRGDLFWLYVVEFARDPAQRRVDRIQNPAAHASYFAIDRSWDVLAEVDA